MAGTGNISFTRLLMSPCYIQNGLLGVKLAVNIHIPVGNVIIQALIKFKTVLDSGCSISLNPDKFTCKSNIVAVLIMKVILTVTFVTQAEFIYSL